MSIEPKCDFCNIYDKNRCKTSEERDHCPFRYPRVKLHLIENRWSLFLDDERYPIEDGRNWKIARTVDEALRMCVEYGAPTYASFDHDLGENEPTGFQFVKSFVYLDQEKKIDIPRDFLFYVHSQNPVGAENIRQYLSQYLRVR